MSSENYELSAADRARRAAASREAATSRVRRASRVVFAIAAALVAAFAGIAASSTHARRKSVSRTTVPTPKATVAIPSVEPPGIRAQSVTPTPTPPAAPPAATSSPPAVVSGGT